MANYSEHKHKQKHKIYPMKAILKISHYKIKAYILFFLKNSNGICHSIGLWNPGLMRDLGQNYRGPHLVWQTTVAFWVLSNECQLRASFP